ncbi:hypothetical protein STEG23_014343, partial [Scotinomys teguina]
NPICYEVEESCQMSIKCKPVFFCFKCQHKGTSVDWSTGNCCEVDSHQSHLIQDVLGSVRIYVIFITFLLLGEEENTLLGEYLSLSDCVSYARLITNGIQRHYGKTFYFGFSNYLVLASECEFVAFTVPEDDRQSARKKSLEQPYPVVNPDTYNNDKPDKI